MFDPSRPMTPTRTMVQRTSEVSPDVAQPVGRTAASVQPRAAVPSAVVEVGTFRTKTMVTTPRQAQALIRNDQPWPTALIKIPDNAGPTNAPNWKTEEFRLTALRMWSRPTSSETKTCRVGLSTTVTKPRIVAITKTCQTWTVWVRASVPRVAAIRAAVALGDHQDPALGEAVGDHAAEQAEDQHRSELQRHGEADRADVSGELQDQPVLGDPLHPQTGGGHDLRAEVEPVVAHLEGAERLRPASAWPMRGSGTRGRG